MSNVAAAREALHDVQLQVLVAARVLAAVIRCGELAEAVAKEEDAQQKWLAALHEWLEDRAAEGGA